MQKWLGGKEDSMKIEQRTYVLYAVIYNCGPFAEIGRPIVLLINAISVQKSNCLLQIL